MELLVLSATPGSPAEDGLRLVADTEVACDLLTIGKLTALGATHPKIKIHILENLSLDLCRKLRKANREIAQLV